MFASVWSLAVGGTSPEASMGPGAVPSATLTSLPMRSWAASKSCTSMLPKPIWDADRAYGARGQIEPTVVTSLMVAKDTLLRSPQEPRLAIRAIEGFSRPVERPGLPPVATRYTGELAEGQASGPAMVNPPSLPVGTGCERSAFDEDPLPVEPAAYICTMEPAIVCCPPYTMPRTLTVLAGSRRLFSRDPQPKSRKKGNTPKPITKDTCQPFKRCNLIPSS